MKFLKPKTGDFKMKKNEVNPAAPNNNGVVEITMRDAWNHFTRINVNQYLEKKGRFNYLKWQIAWYLTKEVDPSAEFHFEPTGSDQSVQVIITVLGHTRTMHLPVLDFANKPIANPTSFDINTCKMRCLVKGLAVCYGLGFYVFCGFNSPDQLIKIGDGLSGAVESPSTVATFSPVVDNRESTNLTGVSSAPVADHANGGALKRALPLPPVGGKA